MAIRLEIRQDNAASRGLFGGAGYTQFGEHAAYYDDGMDALRVEKSLATHLLPELAHTTTIARRWVLPAARRA